jgi:hypothetical protein
MWAHLGIGNSMKNLNGNFSPYFKVANIDSKWLEAVGSPAVNDPDHVTPIGDWKPHDTPQERKPEEVANAPMTEIAATADDFPGQSTLAEEVVPA